MSKFKVKQFILLIFSGSFINIISAQSPNIKSPGSGNVIYERSENYIIIGAVVLLLAMYILFTSYSRKKRAHRIMEEKNRLITHQKMELVAKAELLKKSNDQIRTLSNFKESLAHMAVHDMKNPLNTIMGLSHGEATQKKMRIINKSSGQMFNFITNMLDIYKFEQAELSLDLKAHSLRAIVDEAEQQVKLLLEEKGLSLEKKVSSGITAYFDGVIMSRVLVNLLTNAIKYSNLDDVILIEAKIIANSEGEKEIYLAVKDNGVGIEARYIDKIFDKFNNNKKQTISKSASTGIGLNFCQLAIEAHNGKIIAESSPDIGTSIIINIPYTPYSGDAQHDQLIPEQSKHKVLIASNEIEMIHDFANKLSVFKVHEVSKINAILNEMESVEIRSPWKDKIQSALYSGDQSKLEYLLKEAKAQISYGK